MRANCPAVKRKCAGRVRIKLNRLVLQRRTDNTVSRVNLSSLIILCFIPLHGLAMVACISISPHARLIKGILHAYDT